MLYFIYYSFDKIELPDIWFLKQIQVGTDINIGLWAIQTINCCLFPCVLNKPRKIVDGTNVYTYMPLL